MAERLRELVLALVFLTRLPLAGLLPDRIIPLGRCLWAFPLAGAVAAGIAALPMLVWADRPAMLTAALSLALLVWLTGGLHEDGLADYADGAGARDRAARLAIMRDSRIGAHGAMALVLALAIRWAGLVAAGPAGLVAAAVGGRLAIVGVMAALPPARSEGLGHAAGRASAATLGAAGAIGLALILLLTGVAALLPIAFGAITAAVLAQGAQRRLGGQTGDVLGAASVVTESAILAGFALTG